MKTQTAPKWDHEGKHHTFLGHYDGHDLYIFNDNYHMQRLVARYGPGLGDCKVGYTTYVPKDIHLLEAYLRSSELRKKST